MAKQVTVNAKDADNPTAGPIRTPAPTRPLPPDVTSQVRAQHNIGGGYGLNGYSKASSVPPGHREVSPLGANLEFGDAVLQEVIARGTRAAGISGKLTGEPASVYEGVGESQLRPVNSKQEVPTTHGHKNPNANPVNVGK